MPTRKPSKPGRNRAKTSPLMVRLDEESKTAVADAAELRRISISDYVRTVTVAQAKKEVVAARSQTIALTLEEQLAFWKALQQSPILTETQRNLGKVMRGEL